MSCPYYWWNSGYACRKSGKDVSEDIYYKHCRNYDYDDCPIYKGEDPSGCFLTSACVEAMGLPDDCHELTVLRHFRDNYLRSCPAGTNEIAEYYYFAPQIVSHIRRGANSRDVFQKIYDTVILPCVERIENGDNEGAHRLYRDAVSKLKREHLTKE